MKRVLRGYPTGHPRASLFRHRSLIAARDMDPDAVRDVEPVYRVCRRLRPLLKWLAGHSVAAAGAAGRNGYPVRSAGVSGTGHLADEQALPGWICAGRCFSNATLHGCASRLKFRLIIRYFRHVVHW